MEAKRTESVTNSKNKQVDPNIGSMNGNHSKENNPEKELDSLLIQIGSGQDPLVKFIWKWRSQLISLVLVLTLGFLYYQYSEEAYVNSTKESSRMLEEAKQAIVEYDSILKEQNDLRAKVSINSKDNDASATKIQPPVQSEDQKKLAELETKANDQLNLINSKLNILSDVKGVYSVLGKIYQLQMLNKQSKFQEALELIKSEPFTSTNNYKEQQIFIDLAKLSLANTLLDQDSYKEKGQEILVSLAEKGEVSARVSSAMTLARIAIDADSKQKAKTLIDNIIKDFPAQAESFEELLASLQ